MQTSAYGQTPPPPTSALATPLPPPVVYIVLSGLEYNVVCTERVAPADAYKIFVGVVYTARNGYRRAKCGGLHPHLKKLFQRVGESRLIWTSGVKWTGMISQPFVD